MFEHFFQCPHCWEQISVLLDPSIKETSFIEDCEVCCNPLQIDVVYLNGEINVLNVNIV